MSVIKPRVRGKHLVEHRTRLDQENHETLYAYAAFVDDDADYIATNWSRPCSRKIRSSPPGMRRTPSRTHPVVSSRPST